MTKEELKKEAEEKGREWQRSILPKSEEDYVPYAPYYPYSKGYFAGAEPREKRIAELEAEVKEWKDKADLWCKTANLKDHNIMINKELEKENAELKAQIRKMKCCSNCKHSRTEYEHCKTDKHEKWEIKEK